MQPKQAPYVLMIVLLFVSMRVFAQGIEPAKSAMKNPLSYQGQSALGVAQLFINKKDYVAALKQVERAISSDPKSGVPYMVKAFILDQQHEGKKADNLYLKAVALSPMNGQVLNAYAVHLCEMGQYDSADVNFMKAVTDSSYPIANEAFENAAQCNFKNNNFVLAENRARSALALNPESASALEIMTQVKFKQANFFEARAFMQRREALGPLSIALLQLAIQIEKSAGDNRASANYQRQLDFLLQAQIQPPTGEGQKKP
jgi:type IV pilus assembly protein PilF